MIESANPAEARSIPLDLEVIVSVAYRFRNAECAEPRGFIERYRVRTPAELETAMIEAEAAIWNGTLQSVHERLNPAIGTCVRCGLSACWPTIFAATEHPHCVDLTDCDRRRTGRVRANAKEKPV